MKWESRIVGEDYVNPDQLLDNPGNFRLHPEHQQRALGKVLDEVGWVQRVIVNQRTGHLIDGHLRVDLAKKRKEKTIPVEYVDLSEEEEKLVLSTLDPLAGLATIDEAKLGDLVVELIEDREELFTDLAIGKDYNSLLGDILEDDQKEIIQDEVPDPPSDPITKVGDVWKLGDHTLVCGDAYRLDPLSEIGAIITDPPYGMRLNTDFSDMKSNLKFVADKKVFGGKKYDPVIGDYRDFDAGAILLKIDPVDQFWFGADYYVKSLGDTEHTGSWLVWDKRVSDEMDKVYGSGFELIWSKKRRKREILRHKWAGLFGMEKEDDNKRKHPTQKPIALLGELIGKTEGIIYDPFLGSGTTLIAAEQLDRICYGVEISPAYCDVIVERWENLTGGKAKR